MSSRRTFMNRHNLPDCISAVLTFESYTKGNSHVSVTELIQAPRVRQLRKSGLEEDVIDRLWSSMGTAWHQYADNALKQFSDEYIVEERYYHTILGWVVSGQVDIQIPNRDGTYHLYDWKVTTESKIERGVAAEWEQQLNSYAYLIKQSTGRIISGASVIAILRDHKRNVFKASAEGPVALMDVRLWPEGMQQDYLIGRVKAHQEAEESMAFGEPLPPCTDQEQWRMPDKFAVMDRKKSRAVKIYDTQEEAENKANEIQEGWVEVRPGVPRKCEGNYCGVASKCDQRRNELKEKIAPRGELTPYV